jgi:hypothetical protein
MAVKVTIGIVHWLTLRIILVVGTTINVLSRIHLEQIII